MRSWGTGHSSCLCFGAMAKSQSQGCCHMRLQDGHGLCRSGRFQHACSVSTSAFPPLILTRLLWLAGCFLSNCFSIQAICVRRRLLATSGCKTGAGEKNSRKSSHMYAKMMRIILVNLGTDQCLSSTHVKETALTAKA